MNDSAISIRPTVRCVSHVEVNCSIIHHYPHLIRTYKIKIWLHRAVLNKQTVYNEKTYASNVLLVWGFCTGFPQVFLCLWDRYGD